MILKNGKRIDGCTDTLPVGTVQPFLGLTPPLGYLICQGQLISKVEYPELYNICKSTFGTETETHFYLPDLRGKTLAGYDSNNSAMNTIGKLLGNVEHRHLSPLTWVEKGSVYYAGVTNSLDNVDITGSRDFYGGVTNEFNGSSKGLVNDGWRVIGYYTDYQDNFQPTITVNWIVKAAMLIPHYFTVENTLTSTNTSNALSAAQGKILNDKFNTYLPLSGGTLTGKVHLGQGDANSLHLGVNGRINATIGTDTNATVLGILDNYAAVGTTVAPLNLRGSGVSPYYNKTPLIESGSNNNGSYIKFVDGTMICYLTKSISVDCTSQWGQLYEGSAAVGSLPATFVSAPIVMVTNTAPDGYFEGMRDTTTTTWGTLRMAIPSAATRAFVVNFVAIGKWK